MSPGYVAVAVHEPGRPAVYGPCESHARARQVCTLLGLTDATVWATRVMTLIPGRDPLSVTEASVDPDLLVPVPDDVIDVINSYDAQPLPREQAVVLAIVDGTSCLALVVGPFTTGAAAERWWADHGHAGAGNLVNSWVLPLQPLTGDTAGEAAPSPPAVVRMATTGGTFVYGPFSDTLHATAWFHDLTSTLHLTNVHGASLYPVNAPFDAARQATSPARRTPDRSNPLGASHPATPAPQRPQQPHVVIIDDPADSVSVAVGWFDSADAARAWWQTQQPHLPHAASEVLQVHDP